MADHKGTSREEFWDSDPRFYEPEETYGSHSTRVCEHHLSAELCSGPGHYPQDNPYDDEPPF